MRNLASIFGDSNHRWVALVSKLSNTSEILKQTFERCRQSYVLPKFGTVRSRRVTEHPKMDRLNASATVKADRTDFHHRLTEQRHKNICIISAIFWAMRRLDVIVNGLKAALL